MATSDQNNLEGRRPAPDVGRIIEHVAQNYCDLVSILLRMKIPSVRNDFLAGHILSSPDLELMLVLIDGLYNLFVPPWEASPEARSANATTASKHFSLLCEQSQDAFEIPVPYAIKTHYSYLTWAQAIYQLRSCGYWTEEEKSNQPSEPISLFADPRADKTRTHSKQKKQVGFSDKDSMFSKGASSRTKDDHGEDSSESESSVPSSSKVRRGRSKTQAMRKLSARDHPDSSEYSSSDNGESTDSDAMCLRQQQRGYTQRQVVEPEHFNVNGRESMSTFLDHFERYFMLKFEGNGLDQCTELGRFLDGEAKRAYDAVGGRHIKYKYMKDELIDWYKKQRVGQSYAKKAELSRAVMEEGDTFKLYCMRLNMLGLDAYPHDKGERSRALKAHFLATAPDWMVKCINKRKKTLRIIDPRAKITWKDIEAVAEEEDRDLKKMQFAKSVKEERTSAQVFASQTNTAKPESVPQPVPQETRKSTGLGAGSSHMSNQQQNQVQCYYCGEFGHIEPRCPKKLRAAKCFYCGDQGHYYRDCPQFTQLNHASTSASTPASSQLPICRTCGGMHFGINCPSNAGGNVGAPPTQTSNQGGQQKNNHGAIPKNWSRGPHGVRAGGQGGAAAPASAAGSVAPAHGSSNGRGANRGGWSNGSRGRGGQRGAGTNQPSRYSSSSSLSVPNSHPLGGASASGPFPANLRSEPSGNGSTLT